MKPPKDLTALLIRAAAAVVLGGSAAYWSIPYAYAQRGYHAVGGEGLLILFVVVLPFFVRRR